MRLNGANERTAHMNDCAPPCYLGIRLARKPPGMVVFSYIEGQCNPTRRHSDIGYLNARLKPVVEGKSKEIGAKTARSKLLSRSVYPSKCFRPWGSLWSCDV